MSKQNNTAKQNSNAKPETAKADSVLIIAMKALIEKLSNLPPVPVFDSSKLEAVLTETGASAKEIEQIVAFRLKAHNEKHGDGLTAQLRETFESLAPVFGGYDELGKSIARLASEKRTAGKINLTSAEFKAVQDGKQDAKPEAVSVWGKVAKMRQDGQNWSKIQEVLNLSDSTRVNVYNLARELPEFQPIASA